MKGFRAIGAGFVAENVCDSFGIIKDGRFAECFPRQSSREFQRRFDLLGFCRPNALHSLNFCKVCFRNFCQRFVFLAERVRGSRADDFNE